MKIIKFLIVASKIQKGLTLYSSQDILNVGICRWCNNRQVYNYYFISEDI